MTKPIQRNVIGTWDNVVSGELVACVTIVLVTWMEGVTMLSRIMEDVKTQRICVVTGEYIVVWRAYGKCTFIKHVCTLL